MSRPAPLWRDRGVVLLNALVIVAALAAVSVWLLQKSERVVNRLQVGQVAAQVQLYLDGLEILLITQLEQDKAASPIDHLGESWARRTYNVPLDRGQAFAQLRDLQGLFNLNWLVDPADTASRTAFRQLIAEAGLSTALAARIEGFVVTGGPDQQTAYANAALPMVARGGPVALLQELRQIPGLTAEEFDRLTPWLTALPPDSLLNLNTAPAAVLQAMLPGVSADSVTQLLQIRRETPFASVSDFLQRGQDQLGPAALSDIDEARFTVVSKWFAAQLAAEIPTADGTGRQRRAVLINRPGKPRPSYVMLRWAP